MRVIDRRGGCYEVRELTYGRDYVWRPGRVVVECDCGRRGVFMLSRSVCVCGADHAEVVRRELLAGGLVEEPPWERDYREWLLGGGGRLLRSELCDREEWEEI
ncbi:hypothetical protein Rxycam_00027 [Rubrobacter xylanophilus DSM 9941]|uniref:hypothetical protein n=1 Tax=Rubrobacter xylanophilus TaxID=49319 RepID=UPI001C63E186|nr:hypothetical protein [Rubrobacter xylanophilus]QYJ14231.1 hypothetical protein Rxycam_00027 [Rubrobacter xylanophilus DSM 9941]